MVAQPAVIPTSPPSEPFTVVVSNIGLAVLRCANSAPSAPAEAARWVFRAISPRLTFISRLLPALKPNQPTQRIKPPSATRPRLCPGIKRGVPSVAKRPRRGPSTRMPASAHQAPTLCTTVEPAKSIKPSLANQPWPP
ncbi:hypothetical protein D9M68_764610 [compost metagenome]